MNHIGVRCEQGRRRAKQQREADHFYKNSHVQFFPADHCFPVAKEQQAADVNQGQRRCGVADGQEAAFHHFRQVDIT